MAGGRHPDGVAERRCLSVGGDNGVVRGESPAVVGVIAKRLRGGVNDVETNR